MSKIDAKIFTLHPTPHMRFVLRDVTALNAAVNNYELTSVKILQQWFEPDESVMWACQGEWRDIPLVTGEDEA